jgi:hypothetical protein
MLFARESRTNALGSAREAKTRVPVRFRCLDLPCERRAREGAHLDIL